MNFKIYLCVILFSNAFCCAAHSEINKTKIEYIITAKLDKIETLLLKSREQLLNILNNQSQMKPKYKFTIYSGENGKSFSDHYYHGKSNFFISYRKPINSYVKNFIQLSENFESIFENNKALFPHLGWQYVVEYQSGAMRFYPWFDPDNIMGRDIDWSKMEFYRMTKENKIKDKMLCTKPGMDIGGLGYITTCTIPIIIKNKEYGLYGVDISVSDYFLEVQEYLGNNVESFTFIVQKDKNEILLKPLFYNFIFKDILTLQDLNKDKNYYKINNKLYEGIFENLNIQYVDFQLLHLRRIAK